jgi:alginate O-acetyltransferase complex protein AlgI
MFFTAGCIRGMGSCSDFRLSPITDWRLASRARLFVALSLLVNLGMLGFFKYYNFFSENLVQTLTRLGVHADALLILIALPAGLSFFTLKKMGYVIDVARGNLEPTRDLVGFSLFVSFFPQVTDGPIDRAQKLLPQFQSPRVWKAENFLSAWPLIVMGFFKKVVIADSIKVIVDMVFSLEHPTILLMLSGALGFALQILADFSAYTDLSRGVSRLFGFETSENFRTPYLSLTPTDFWNRWHITLSTWLRDYIFFPLRRTLLRSRLPQWLTDTLPPLVTMLLSGIWHGSGWTYIAWGLFFGVLIAVYQTLGLGGAWKPSTRLTGFLAWLVMFTFIVLSFVIFRAPSLAWVGNVFLSSPLIGSHDTWISALVVLSMAAVYTAPLIVKHLLDRHIRPDSFLHTAYFALATVSMFFFLNASSSDFFYFQF